MRSSSVPSLQVFDPRRGEEYRFAVSSRGERSSVDLGLLVVVYAPAGRGADRPPALSLPVLDVLVADALLRTGTRGFTTRSPATASARQALPPGTVEQESGGTTLAYFPLEAAAVERQLDLRRRLVSYEEWTVGSCSAPFQPIPEPRGGFSRVEGWESDRLWGEPEKIGALSVFSGETGESVLFTRLYAGMDAVLEPLLS